MNASIRLLLHCFAGVAIGACTVLLAVVGVLTTAFLLSVDIVLPGVIQVWRTTENGAVALNFVPQPIGMIVLAGAVAIGYASVRWIRSAPPRHPIIP